MRQTKNRGSVLVAHMGRIARNLSLLIVLVVVAACSKPEPSGAAPYASYVMDARTGETLYEKNANARLHPASLTKMMTLYIAFQEIEAGRMTPDTLVTISKKAAAEPPSKLGLKAGQKIALRYLIRAAAVKSANDAATAIGEAISGSEAEFARRMTDTARAIGMDSTTFKNANGLTRDGHLSTARDMSVLGRHLFYDFPQYYNIFSRRETDAGTAEVRNTNRKFLDGYEGADGIKTGYTVAAGFNLTGSAERGGTRIIATVFGGTSTAQRNAKMVELLDLGFARAPRNAPTQSPVAPGIIATPDVAVAAAVDEAPVAGGVGKTVRVAGALTVSPRPKGRPGATEVQVAAAEPAIDEALRSGIDSALAEALGMEIVPADPAATQVASTDVVVVAPPADTLEAQSLALAGVTPDAGSVEDVAGVVALAAVAPPPARRKPIFDSTEETTVVAEAEQVEEEVVVRVSTSGGSHWGVNVGRFASRSEAERALLKTQLAESATLNSSLRKVVERGGGYDANFLGLSQDQADLACRRLQARAIQCFTMGP
jgi:D-alanyl-D-alanine carboxypeptidase